MADKRTSNYERKQSLHEREDPRVVDVAARGLGIRHIQSCVVGFSCCMAYSLRTSLSVAIVAMVDYEASETNQTTPLSPTYDWNEKTQGLLLSSFFWGYVVMQLPAGVITEKYGGHRFLCFSILASSCLTLFLPQCAYLGGWFLVCINRMCQGLVQGFTYPSIFALLGVWSPPSERGTHSGIALGGSLLGTVAATPISGFLAAAYGWPTIFYVFGVVGIVVSFAAIFFGADTPARHRMISEAEKKYIEDSLGGAKVQRGIPWKSMFTSTPVIATVITMASLNFIFLTFFTKIPTYLSTVLKYNIKDNGVLSAIPYFVSWISAFFFSWLCDFITDRGWLGLTTARKVFNSIGQVGSALCLVLMSYAKSSAMAVVLLTGFLGIQSAVFPGVQANFVDVAPNYSGTIYSIANFLSAFLGIAGPIGVGFIVSEAGSVEQWRIVLFLSAAILCLGNFVFVIWGTAETQLWNWPDKEEGNYCVKRHKKKVQVQV